VWTRVDGFLLSLQQINKTRLFIEVFVHRRPQKLGKPHLTKLYATTVICHWHQRQLTYYAMLTKEEQHSWQNLIFFYHKKFLLYIDPISHTVINIHAFIISLIINEWFQRFNLNDFNVLICLSRIVFLLVRFDNYNQNLHPN